MGKNMKLYCKIILCLSVMGVMGQAYGMDAHGTDQQLSSALCQVPADLRPHIIYLSDARAMVCTILALQQTCKLWRGILNSAAKKTLVSQWFFEGKEFDEQEELIQSLRNMSFYPFKVYTPELYIMTGANVRLKSKLGYLPLESLICTQTNESFAQPLKLLIRAGLAIDTQIFDNRTALHCTAHTGDISSAKTLLSSGANPNIQDNYGNTPLHYACRNCHISIVEQLLKHGAQHPIKNNYNETASEQIPFSTNATRNRIPMRIFELLNGSITVEHSIANPIDTKKTDSADTCIDVCLDIRQEEFWNHVNES